jgi:hypothetical protein
MMTDINKDEWVAIDEYPNYLINRTGEIYNVITKRKLRGQNVNGYLRVELKKEDNKKSKQYIHKLVAKTFIPNPNNNPKVYFINGDHLDCRVSNLKWGTQKDALNTEYALKRKSECQKGKSKSLHSTKKRIKTMQEKYGVKVEQYTMDGVLLSKFNAYAEAQRITGINAGNIRQCCLGLSKHAGGYIWKHQKL